jgi:predicted DsbA family dithiol-disulfide isomerase
MTTVEVFADISCPFTHVGLKRVVAQLRLLDRDTELIVRAWPLEWVNDGPLEAGPVAAKIAAFEEQLGIDDFRGFRADAWPDTTIPALNLAAVAFEVDASTGLAVSLALRSALFEDGFDISDPAVLADLATSFHLAVPDRGPLPRVEADYAEGQQRGVRGSPDFWVGDTEFFCPALDLGHDDEGALLTAFDQRGLEHFIEAATSGPRQEQP